MSKIGRFFGYAFLLFLGALMLFFGFECFSVIWVYGLLGISYVSAFVIGCFFTALGAICFKQTIFDDL